VTVGEQAASKCGEACEVHVEDSQGVGASAGEVLVACQHQSPEPTAGVTILTFASSSNIVVPPSFCFIIPFLASVTPSSEALGITATQTHPAAKSPLGVQPHRQCAQVEKRL